MYQTYPISVTVSCHGCILRAIEGAQNCFSLLISMSSPGAWLSFDGFEVDRVLMHDPLTKTVAVLGRLSDKPGQAIALLQRRHFAFDNLQSLLCDATKLDLVFSNDIYAKYTGVVPEAHAMINVDTIYPATEKHIQKYSEQPRHLVQETPALYQSIVQRYIKSIPQSRLQWVYNILEKKAEVERLIFEDPDPEVGFMLHPDFKWDQQQVEQLYCLGLSIRRDIGSLRNLTIQHVPLLRNIKEKGSQAIQERFGVAPTDMRVFVHYYPSYYHFHVHFTHVKYIVPGALVAKAHLLDDIIDNICTFGSDYYQKRTLTCIVGEDEDIWRLLNAENQQQQQQQQQQQ